MIWYDMIWYDMIWYDMIWYDMIWYDMIWYDMIWYDMIWYDMIWYDMIWYDMIWYDMIWYDMIWYDMIWYDMIWYDMIWYDMIWYDTIWYEWYGMTWHWHWHDMSHVMWNILKWYHGMNYVRKSHGRISKTLWKNVEVQSTWNKEESIRGLETNAKTLVAVCSNKMYKQLAPYINYTKNMKLKYGRYHMIIRHG